MTEWRGVADSNLEVSSDGRVRRDGVEFVPCVGGKGHRILGVNGKTVTLHRLIAIGFIPNPEAKPCVDHADGDPLNNCVENLRWATYAENNRNRKKNNIKISGLPKGVSKSKKRFAARIKYDRILYHIGTYVTMEEASAAYEAKAAELFGEFYKVPADA